MRLLPLVFLLVALPLLVAAAPVGVAAQQALTPTATPVGEDPFEPDNNLMQTSQVQPGEGQMRTFAPAGDADYVQLAQKAGRRYQLTTSQLGPGVDTHLTVRIGAEVYTNDDASATTLASLVEWSATTEGTALIEVRNQAGQYGAAQSYRLDVTLLAPTPTPTASPSPTASPTVRPDACQGEEPANDQPPGTTLVLAESRCAHIDRQGDLDVYTFPVKAGRAYQVVVSAVAADVDPVLVVEVAGQRFESVGTLERWNVGTTATTNEPGSVALLPGQEATLSPPSSQNTEVSSEMPLSLPFPSSALTFQRSNASSFRSNALTLQRSNASITFLASASGNAQATVRSNLPGGSAVVDRHLYTVVAAEYDRSSADPHEPDDTPAPLPLNSTQQRAFDPAGDTDQALLTPLIPGRRYTIVATTTRGSSPTLEVEVDGKRYVNEQSAIGSSASQVEFQVERSTSALIVIRNRDALWGPEQRYTLTARETIPPTPAPVPTQAPQPTAGPAPDAYEPDTETSPPLYLIGGVMQRAFDSREDTDFASLAVKAGARYQAEVRALSAGVDPYLEVFLWNGQQWELVAYNDDGTPGETTARVTVGPLAVSTTMLLKLSNRTPGPLGQAARYEAEVRLLPPVPTPVPTLTPVPPPIVTGGGGAVGGASSVPTLPTPIAPPPAAPAPSPAPAGVGGASGASGTVRVLVYVDENLDEAWQAAEGVARVPVQVIAEGVLRAEWLTGSDGVAIFTAPEGATISIPLLGQSQTVSGSEPLIFRVAPLTLPARLP